MSWLFSILNRFGLPAMLLLILLEYACFPVSSEIVLPFCGALAARQKIPFLFLVILSTLAGLCGTSLCYIAGWLGGNPLLEKIMRRFPKTEPGLRSSFEKFRKRGPMIVLFGRFIPICRTYLGFAAGALHLPPSKYLPYSMIGIFFWNALLCGFGYVLQENWPVVASWYTRYKNILIPLLLILLLLFALKSKGKKNPHPYCGRGH